MVLPLRLRALSQVVIAGLFFWFNHWQYYLTIILIAPNLTLLLYGLYFMVESPYFLLEKKGDLPGAMAAMRKIATINNTDLTVLEQVEKDFQAVLDHTEEEKHKNRHLPEASRFQIFKDFKYLKILLLVAAIEIAANAYYYGVQFSLGNVGSSFGINILITGCIEFTGFFTSSTAIIIRLLHNAGTPEEGTLGFQWDMHPAGAALLHRYANYAPDYPAGCLPVLQQ